MSNSTEERYVHPKFQTAERIANIESDRHSLLSAVACAAVTGMFVHSAILAPSAIYWGVAVFTGITSVILAIRFATNTICLALKKE